MKGQYPLLFLWGEFVERRSLRETEELQRPAYLVMAAPMLIRGGGLPEKTARGPSEVSDFETEGGISWKKTGVRQINTKEK